MTFEEDQSTGPSVRDAVLRPLFDVAVDHGRGATLWDTQGREYIDFTSGIGVCSLGYADEGWVNAITEQAGKLGHISNLFYAEPYVKAAEKLCRKAGMSNVFFANSGAESNEGLIKLARKYSFDKYGKGRGPSSPSTSPSTAAPSPPLSATGQDVFHNYFFPFTEGLPPRRRQRLRQRGSHGRTRCVRRHVRAHPGRGRRAPPGPGVCAEGGRPVRQAGLAAPHRRGADRRGPHRLSLCLPAVRHPA